MRQTSKARWRLALFLAVCVLRTPAPAQTTRTSPPGGIALVGGTVIDGTSAPFRKKCTVLVQGDRIVACGQDVAVPAGFETIDVSGKFVAPGLVDMHGHLYAINGKDIANEFSPYALLYLAGGVTTVFSPGDFDPDGTVAFREAVKRGEAIGPRILTAGPYFDHHPSNVPWIHGFTSVDEARQRFEAWKDRIDGIKVYTSILEPELVATIALAHKSGLRVVGHLDSIGAARAVELGIDGLEHGIFAMSDLGGCGNDYPTIAYLKKLAALDMSGPQVKALIDAIVAHGVVIDPTTVTTQELLPDFESVTPDWQRFLAPEAVQPVTQLLTSIQGMGKRMGHAWLDAAHAALRKQNEFVKAVHDRGGIVVAGTDPVSPALVPGYGLHRELRNLVEAGLTPLEAIRAATADSARALRRQSEVGTIARGRIADLIVLRSNPAEDIAAIGSIEMVIARGVRYDPAELRRRAEHSIK